jgi:general secretion pathway protein H
MSAIGEPDRLHSQAGTTLIEAMVVMAITVAVGAIIFPDLRQGLAGVAFSQAVAGVRADLRMARAQALRTGAPVEIVVDRGGLGYGWTHGPSRGLVEGLSMSPQGGVMDFYPDGSASGAALSLTNGRAETHFEVDRNTGVLRIAS